LALCAGRGSRRQRGPSGARPAAHFVNDGKVQPQQRSIGRIFAARDSGLDAAGLLGPKSVAASPSRFTDGGSWSMSAYICVIDSRSHEKQQSPRKQPSALSGASRTKSWATNWNEARRLLRPRFSFRQARMIRTRASANGGASRSGQGGASALDASATRCRPCLTSKRRFSRVGRAEITVVHVVPEPWAQCVFALPDRSPTLGVVADFAVDEQT